MDHARYKEQLSALLDGELNDAERAEALAHLDACEECQAYFAELTALHDALGDMEEIEAPAGFAEGVMARLHDERSRAKARRAWRGWAGLAACAAVVLLAVNALPRGGSGATESAASVEPPRMAAQSVTAAAATTGTTEESAEAAPAPEMTEESWAESKMLFMSGGAAVPGAAMETLVNDMDAAYGGLADELFTLTGAGAQAWLAEHGWQGESGDWYVPAADLRDLPEELTLIEPLPDDYDGAVRVEAAEPPEETEVAP